MKMKDLDHRRELLSWVSHQIVDHNISSSWVKSKDDIKKSTLHFCREVFLDYSFP